MTQWEGSDEWQETFTLWQQEVNIFTSLMFTNQGTVGDLNKLTYEEIYKVNLKIENTFFFGISDSHKYAWSNFM